MQILNYKAYGEKHNPALMIIHGLFGSLDNWMTMAKLWSQQYYVIAMDVRNHGKSFHSDMMTFQAMNDDINIILDKEKMTDFCLMGHSMGGKIAMNFAADFPEKIKKLIVVDVAPYAYDPHHNDVFEMMENMVPSHYDSRAEIEKALGEYFHQESLVQFMSKNIRRNDSTMKFEWKFNLPILEKEYEYLITSVPQKGFAGPTLFIGGERSKYISKETSGLIFELYPNFELEYVSNAGHWVHADNPTEFYQKVSDFLLKS